jgi:hypothetical protein
VFHKALRSHLRRDTCGKTQIRGRELLERPSGVSPATAVAADMVMAGVLMSRKFCDV